MRDKKIFLLSLFILSALIIIILLVLMIFPTADGAHTNLSLTATSSPPAAIKPGGSVYLGFNLTNTGDVQDRYMIGIDSQYAWHARLENVVNQSGAGLNFTQKGSEFMLNEYIQPGETVLITVAVNAPALGSTPEFSDIEYLNSRGLLAGTTYRLSVTAKAESDNFATGDEAQYSIQVEAVHAIGLRCDTDIVIDPYGDRTTAMELNVTHLSNSNMGGMDSAQIHLTFQKPGADWDIRLSEYNFSLAPRVSRTVLLTVTLPEGIFSFDAPYYKEIIIIGNESISDNVESARVKVWLKQRGSVSISLADEEEKNAVPGETVTFNFTLTNTGNGPDSFVLRGGSEYAGWVTIPVEKTGIISPGDSVEVSINVSVPISAPPPMGTRARVSLTAVSTATPDFFDSGNAYVIVGPLSGLKIEGAKIVDIYPPSTANITISVNNTGNHRENMSFMVEPVVNMNGVYITLTDSRWGVSIHPPYVELNAGEECTIHVGVSAGSTFVYGDVLIFYVDGLIDGKLMDRTFLGAKVGLTHGVSIKCNSTSKSGELGEKVYYFFNITNTGSARDVFYLKYTVSPPWYSYLGVTQLSLAPHQSAFADAMIRVPTDAEKGAQSVFTLTAENRDVQANLSVTTTAASTRSLQLLSSNLTHHVFLGESMNVGVIVRNRGNVEDSVSLTSVTSTHWSSAIVPNRVNIPAFSSFSVNLTIKAPSVAVQDDKADFIVSALSQHNRKVNANITVKAVLAMAEPVQGGANPYYIFEHPDYTAALHGYTARGRAVEYGFRVKNIDSTDQTITFQHSPTVLQVSTDHSSLSMKPGEEVLVYLKISAPETAQIGDYSTAFYLTSGSGRHEAFLVSTTVMGVDLKVEDIESDHLLEGKKGEVRVKITLSGSGYEGIPDPSLLSFTNIVVETEYGDESHTNILERLNIGESVILRFEIKPDILKWYEKEDTIRFKVFITHYESLLKADDNPENNHKETTLTVYDAPPSGIVTSSEGAGIVTSILLMLLVLHYFRKVEAHFRTLPDDPRVHAWRALFLGLLTGLVFTLPMSNLQSETLISIIILACIALSVYLALQARVVHIGAIVPILFFASAVLIATSGTGISGALRALFISTTPLTPAHYLLGIATGIGAYLFVQYRHPGSGETQVEWLQPVIGSGLALMLGIFYIVSPGFVDAILLLMFTGLFLFYLINSLPMLRNPSLIPGLYITSLSLYTLIFLIIITGHSEGTIVFLLTPIAMNNFLFMLSLLVISTFFSFLIYRLHLLIGQEIENLYSIFRRATGEEDVEKALTRILMSQEEIERRHFR